VISAQDEGRYHKTGSACNFWTRPKIPEFVDTVLSRLHYTGAVKDAAEDAEDKKRRCSCGRCCWGCGG
jgi:hypothetical protein